MTDTTTFEIAPTLLSLGVDLLDLGLPRRATLRARDSIQRHAQALAEELTDIFREDVWPTYKSSGASIADVQEAVNSFRPLTVQGFVAAYEHSVNETKRSAVARRTAPRRARFTEPTRAEH